MEPENSAVVFSKMLRWQISVTLLVATIAFFLAGLHAALSVILGGLAVVCGVFVASKIAKRSEGKTEASAILINLLKAEAVKILVIVVVLFITFKIYKQLVPMALIVGLAGAALFSGAAMAKLDKDKLRI